MKSVPLVSICSITYNHAPFIRQCLDGFLMQQTDFPIEIIINDDCSTDGTTEIVREYAKKHPDKIFPILHEENQYSKGERGMYHKFVFPKARGKYIAICEGDDFWIDPMKLQKQVDFLEAHSDFSMVCSDARVLGPDGVLPWKQRYEESCEIPVSDTLIKLGSWIYTASMLFRGKAIKDLPDYALKCHVTDYPLAVHMAMIGKIHYFHQKMVAYRFMRPGSWSETTRFDENYFADWLSEIKMLQGYNEFSNRKYEKLFQRTMGKVAINYLRQVPSMRKNVLSVLPDFPKWLNWNARFKWLRICMGIKSIKHR